jgi:hypothetical protein
MSEKKLEIVESQGELKETSAEVAEVPQPRRRKILSVEQIKNAPDLSTKDLEVPEWPDEDGNPGIIVLKALSAYEAQVYQKKITLSQQNKDNAMLEMVVQSCVDDDGNRLFSPKDIAWMKDKSMAAYNRIQRAILELNGLSDPKKAEEAAKNV